MIHCQSIPVKTTGRAPRKRAAGQMTVRSSDSLVGKVEHLAVVLEEAILVCVSGARPASSPSRHHDLLLVAVLHHPLHRRLG